MRKLQLTLLALFGLCTTGQVLGAAAEPQIIGQAFDQRNGQLLYSESHYCSSDGLLCSIEYRDTAGRLIAFKDLDYRESRHGPALTLLDIRGSKEHRRVASKAEDVVVDAGFDNYIRSKWQTLAAGNSIRFPFVVAGSDRSLKMRAQRDDPQDCPAQELCLKVELDSWFLGVFLDPIRLSYSREQRRLLRFQGVSDIRSPQGDTLLVDIHYQYFDSGAAQL